MSKIEIKPMNWQNMVTQIIDLSLEMDPNDRWSYTRIGAAVDTSRSTIGRLMADADRPNHLDEPKWSQGMALIQLHAGIREKYKLFKQQRTEHGSDN